MLNQFMNTSHRSYFEQTLKSNGNGLEVIKSRASDVFPKAIAEGFKPLEGSIDDPTTIKAGMYCIVDGALHIHLPQAHDKATAVFFSEFIINVMCYLEYEKKLIKNFTYEVDSNGLGWLIVNRKES